MSGWRYTVVELGCPLVRGWSKTDQFIFVCFFFVFAVTILPLRVKWASVTVRVVFLSNIVKQFCQISVSCSGGAVWGYGRRAYH